MMESQPGLGGKSHRWKSYSDDKTVGRPVILPKSCKSGIFIFSILQETCVFFRTIIY